MFYAGSTPKLSHVGRGARHPPHTLWELGGHLFSAAQAQS